MPLAVGARPAALGAQSDFTGVAVVGAVAAAGVTAVSTALAVPVFETHIGAACVVGLQNLLHEQKEIAHPPLSQSVADGHAAIPLAE